MRRLLWAFVHLLIASGADAQTFDWVRTAGPIAFDAGMGLARSPAGDLYAAGLFSDVLSFGDTTLVSPGGWRSFLVKLSSSGEPLWARQFDPVEPDVALVATNDAVYLAGSFTGSIRIDATSLTSAGATDVVVARFDPAGHLIWAKRSGGTLTDLAGALALDATGNLILTGGFRGSANFGGIVLSSAGGEDAFVTRMTSMGTTDWARRLGAAQDQFGSGIEGTGDGGYVVAGSFHGTFPIGGSTLVSAGDADVWVARFSSAGAAQWATSAGGVGEEFPYGFSAGADGSSAITGFFLGAAAFGSTTLVSSGDRDAFVARLGADGSFAWSDRAGGTGLDNGLAASLDSSGRLTITGFFSGNADFQGRTLTSEGTRDLFVATYASSGSLEWVLQAGGAGADGASRVLHDALGRVYLSGSIDQTAHFGGIDVPAEGTTLFLARLIDPLSQLEPAPPGVANAFPGAGYAWPNPSSGGSITVALAKGEVCGATLLLFDATGRRHGSLSPRSAVSPRAVMYTLPSALPAGEYFLYNPESRQRVGGPLAVIR
ncbi:MAG: hypothetical protein U0527_06975 [Candidatus Eisenbacteria bacterium]